MGLLARLPGGHRAKQHAVPILVEEALAIVVPHGVDGSGGPQALTGADEALNVPERGSRDRIDFVPIGVAGSYPGLDAGLGKGLYHLVEAGGDPVIPGHGDHVFGQSGNGGQGLRRQCRPRKAGGGAKAQAHRESA